VFAKHNREKVECSHGAHIADTLAAPIATRIEWRLHVETHAATVRISKIRAQRGSQEESDYANTATMAVGVVKESSKVFRTCPENRKTGTWRTTVGRG